MTFTLKFCKMFYGAWINPSKHFFRESKDIRRLVFQAFKEKTDTIHLLTPKRDLLSGIRCNCQR